MLRSRWLLPLSVMTSAWRTMRSILAAAMTWSPKTSPQRAKGQINGRDHRGVFVMRGTQGGRKWPTDLKDHAGARPAPGQPNRRSSEALGLREPTRHAQSRRRTYKRWILSTNLYV